MTATTSLARTRRGTSSKPAAQQPLMEPTVEPSVDVEPATDETTTAVLDDVLPWIIDGKKVVSESRVESMPGVPFKFSRIVFDDGSEIYRCVECPADEPVIGTRGFIYTHRAREHGAKRGGGPKHLRVPDSHIRIDVPDEVSNLTIAELLAYAPTFTALGRYVEELEDERDALRAEVDEQRVDTRANQVKLDTYDDLAAELKELRAWKKKVTAKFQGLGFKLMEDEN